MQLNWLRSCDIAGRVSGKKWVDAVAERSNGDAFTVAALDSKAASGTLPATALAGPQEQPQS